MYFRVIYEDIDLNKYLCVVFERGCQPYNFTEDNRYKQEQTTRIQ